jgi:WD40 repeat protein/serine/threonine protein kinase
MTLPGSTDPASIGRYELISTLGVGGFASVHRAYDSALDGDVALKILLPQYVQNQDIRRRFVQEARLLRRVDSRSLISVYDIGETTDDRPYFVMELAVGGVLGDRINTARRAVAASGGASTIDQTSIVHVVNALADGLGALHNASVVHRDIKPDNLLIAGADGIDGTQIGMGLIGPGERLLIGDLGLAKDHDQTSAGPTVAGGTPFYRAPEQMVPGSPITAAADIYAATGVLWFMLTGNHPPETQAVAAQLTSMPAVWQPILERGLELDPTLRYATIGEWAAEARAAADASPSTGVQSVHVGDSLNLCPYKGMAAFQPEDAGLYFGRDEMIDTLVARMQDHSVLVIGGPSGSGKSSLMRAGLIPRLSRGAIAGSQQWRTALFNPGSDAVGELVHQLRRVKEQSAQQASGSELNMSTGAEIRRDDLPHGAKRWLEDGTTTLLAIDQFEELFTLNPNRADQELFIDTLAAMTESEHSRIKITIALRADFYGVCAAFPWLSDRINESQLLVGPMARHELREAITLPAQRAGLRLEDELTDAILEDAGSGGGALPLLSHALMETWLRRRGSQLTLEGYRAAGGVSGAIAQRADEVFTQLSTTEQTSAQRLLLQLINPGEGSPDTRRRIKRQSLRTNDGMAEVLETLASARLLTVDDDAVEVAHEALIRSWPRLRTWIDDNRESLQTRRRISHDAADWDAHERSFDLLYRGTQLASALEWLDDHGDELDVTGNNFLSTAKEVRDAADHEREAAEAKSRRTRMLAIASLAALAAAAVAASVVAFSALGRSQSNERNAETQQVQALAEAAAANASEQPILATGLALESISRADPSIAAARDALVEARVGLDTNRFLPQPFGRPVIVGDMQSIALTPDGERFVTGARSGGDVVFWDRVQRVELQRFPNAHGDDGVKDLQISGDGRWMVSTGSIDALLWDLTAEQPEPILLAELERSGSNGMWASAFSPDGSLIGVSTERHGVLVFESATGDQVSASAGQDITDMLSIAFVDNDRLVLGDGTGMLQLVDARTAEAIGEPVVAGDDGNDIWELVLDPTGDLLASASTDETVKTWRIESDRLVPQATLRDNTISNPRGVVFTGSGTELLVGSNDGLLHRSDALTGQLIPGVASAALHTDDVKAVGRSNNGWLVSLGDDQRVQVWREVADLAPIDEVLAETAPITDLALSPSAGLLAASTESGTMIYDAASGELIHRFDGQAESVGFVTDDVIVTGSVTGDVRLWDLPRDALISETTAHAGTPIRSIAASSDREHFASGGEDGTVVLWSTSDLGAAATLTNHNNRQVTGVDFTPNGDTVVSVGWDQQIRFSPIDGGETTAVPVTQDGPQTLAVHPTQDLVAIGGSQENVEIIDFDGTVISTMAPHEFGVWDLDFTADGLSIVAGSRRPGLVQLWDWATAERLGPAFGDTYDRNEPDIAVGPNGTVWSSGLDGVIRRLDVLDEEVGCELSRDVMDAGLLQRFLSGEPLASCHDE